MNGYQNRVGRRKTPQRQSGLLRAWRLAFEIAEDAREAPKDRLTAMRTALVAGERQAELLGAAAPKQVEHRHGGAVGLAVAVQARIDLSPEVLAEVGRVVSQAGLRTLTVEPDPDPVPPGAPKG